MLRILFARTRRYPGQVRPIASTRNDYKFIRCSLDILVALQVWTNNTQNGIKRCFRSVKQPIVKKLILTLENIFSFLLGISTIFFSLSLYFVLYSKFIQNWKLFHMFSFFIGISIDVLRSFDTLDIVFSFYRSILYRCGLY